MYRMLLLVALLMIAVTSLVADAAYWPSSAQDDSDPQDAYVTFTGLSAFPDKQFAVVQLVGEYTETDDDYSYKDYYKITYAKGDSVTVKFWGNKDYNSYPPYLTCDPTLKKFPGRSVVKQRKLNITLPDWDNENTPYTMHIFIDSVPAGFQRSDFYYKVAPARAKDMDSMTFRCELEKASFNHGDFVITATEGIEHLVDYTYDNSFGFDYLIAESEVQPLIDWAQQQPGMTVQQVEKSKADIPKRNYFVPFHRTVSSHTFSIALSVLTGLAVIALFVVVMTRKK